LLLESYKKNYNKILTFKDIAIKVSSNIYSPLKWLEEFLSPSFVVNPNNIDSLCSVELICDENLYIKSLNKIKQINPEIKDVFALDNRMIQLPMFNGGTSSKYLIDKEFEILYKIEKENNIFSVISKNDSRFCRKALMRILREIAMNHCLTLGHQLIHCAALSYNNKGILITGPKGAGKTTLLIGLLQLKNSYYIANDRASVNIDNYIPSIQGIPTIVNIKKNTLKIFSEFHDNLLASKYDYHMNLNKSDIGPTDNIQPDKLGNYSLNPHQFCNLLKTKQKATASLHLILFPVIKKDNTKTKLVKLSPSEASKKLLYCIFRSGSNYLNTPIFRLSDKNKKLDNENKISDIYLKITSAVQSFEINISIDDLKDPTSLSSVLDRALN